MSKIWMVCIAAMVGFFFITNAIWTAIDGKPRPGSAFFKDNRVLTFLMEIPNPFLPDPSEFLLEPLPPLDGWAVRQISDPWTVRPVKRDGTITSDAEMDAIIAREASGEFGYDLQMRLNQEDYRNSVHRNDGAKRTGANFSRGEDVGLNVVIELLRAPLDLQREQFSGLDRYFFEVANFLSEASDLLASERKIAGLPFQGFVSHDSTGQDVMRGAPIRLLTRSETFEVRIWGFGTESDVEELINGLRVVMVDHPSRGALEP